MAVKRCLLLLLCAASPYMGEASTDAQRAHAERNLSTFLHYTQHRLDALESRLSKLTGSEDGAVSKRMDVLEANMAVQSSEAARVAALEAKLEKLESVVHMILPEEPDAGDSKLKRMIETIASSMVERALAQDRKEEQNPEQKTNSCGCMNKCLQEIFFDNPNTTVHMKLDELKEEVSSIRTALDSAVKHQHSELEVAYTRLLAVFSSLTQSLMDSMSSQVADTREAVLQKIDEVVESITGNTSNMLEQFRHAVTMRMEKITKTSRDIDTIARTEMVASLQEMAQHGFNTMTETLENITKEACTLTRDDRTCEDFMKRGKTTSGVYTLHLEDGLGPLDVYCDMSTDGGGWVVFQRRKDGSVNFYRNWTEYEMGFGNLTSEFWLGTFHLNRLSQFGMSRLRVDLQAWSLERAFAAYSSFHVGDSSTLYLLNVSGYSGTAGDGMAYSNMALFSTPDMDHDTLSSTHCARDYHRGAWWHKGCTHVNLNGPYGGQHSSGDKVIFWDSFRSNHALKSSEMKVK